MRHLLPMNEFDRAMRNLSAAGAVPLSVLAEAAVIVTPATISAASPGRAQRSRFLMVDFPPFSGVRRRRAGRRVTGWLPITRRSWRGPIVRGATPAARVDRRPHRGAGKAADGG